MEQGALRFGQLYAGELRERPLSLFDSGPTNTSADDGKNEPVEAADDLARAIGARARVRFGGRHMPDDAGRFTRRLIASGKSGSFVSGEFRNFDRIGVWARGIGAELLPVRSVEAIEVRLVQGLLSSDGGEIR